MGTEEQVEQQSQQVLEAVAKTGVTITVQASESLARQLIKASGWAIKQGGRKIAETANSGKVSEARLQKITGGDVHDLQFDPATLREVTKSLRRSGITYAVEKIDDDHWRLMFTGKDQDHIRIAMERAFAKLGMKFDFQQAAKIDQPEVEQTSETQSEATPDADQNKPAESRDESPTRKEQAQQGGEKPIGPAPETNESPTETTQSENRTRGEKKNEQTAGDERKPAPDAATKTEQAAKEPQKHSDRSRTPGSERKHGKRTKKEFLEQLNKRANEKLAASKHAPEITKSRSKSK